MQKALLLLVWISLFLKEILWIYVRESMMMEHLCRESIKFLMKTGLISIPMARLQLLKLGKPTQVGLMPLIRHLTIKKVYGYQEEIQ